MANIRWGILGCGDVAEKKGGPALYKAAGSELVAVMRRDAAKAADFARRHGAKRSYASIEGLLADPEVDAVYVATPPSLHKEQTLLAASAGKHVLVEKPMAVSAAECDAMIAACEAAGVQLHVAYYRRFYPKFVAARTLLREEERLGKIVAARLQMCASPPRVGEDGLPWRLRPEISGGGLFVDVGSHRLDMLLYLLGDAAEATGYADNSLGIAPAEDSVVFALRLASGAQVSGSFHFATALERDVLEIYGTEATAVFDPFDAEEFALIGGKGDGIYRQPTPSPTHLPFVQELVQVYKGAAVPHVTGVEGAKATRIMDTLLSTQPPPARKSSASSTAT